MTKKKKESQKNGIQNQKGRSKKTRWNDGSTTLHGHRSKQTVTRVAPWLSFPLSVCLSLCLSVCLSVSLFFSLIRWTARGTPGREPFMASQTPTGAVQTHDDGRRRGRLFLTSEDAPLVSCRRRLFFFDFMWFFVLFWWPSSLSFFFFLYLPVPCSAGSLSLLGPLVWFDPESIRALCGAVKNFSAVLLRRRSNPVKPVESHFQTWNTTMSNPVEAVVGVARSKTDCFLVWKGNFWQKKHWK